MLILSPGPANITERVRLAMTLPDIGHRSCEFADLLQACRLGILQVAGVPSGYTSVVLNGSGTTGIESAITALPGATQGMLVLTNGHYGERAVEIARTYGYAAEVVDFGWTGYLDLDRVEQAMRATTADVVYLVHHETTTGMLNPLAETARMAKAHGKWVVVDAVSSIAGEQMDLEGWGVDLIIGSPQKCIRGVPGVAFVVVSDAMLAMLKRRTRVAYTNDLVEHAIREEAGEPPFTPAVQVLFALREALRETLDEGVSHRIEGYAAKAKVLRDGVAELGLELLLPREWYSNTMTSIVLPRGKTYESMHDPLKRRGYLIYKSQGTLAAATFRIGTVGVMTETDIRGLIEAIREVL